MLKKDSSKRNYNSDTSGSGNQKKLTTQKITSIYSVSQKMASAKVKDTFLTVQHKTISSLELQYQYVHKKSPVKETALQIDQVNYEPVIKQSGAY